VLLSRDSAHCAALLVSAQGRVFVEVEELMKRVASRSTCSCSRIWQEATTRVSGGAVSKVHKHFAQLNNTESSNRNRGFAHNRGAIRPISSWGRVHDKRRICFAFRFRLQISWFGRAGSSGRSSNGKLTNVVDALDAIPMPLHRQ